MLQFITLVSLLALWMPAHARTKKSGGIHEGLRIFGFFQEKNVDIRSASWVKSTAGTIEKGDRRDKMVPLDNGTLVLEVEVMNSKFKRLDSWKVLIEGKSGKYPDEVDSSKEQREHADNDRTITFPGIPSMKWLRVSKGEQEIYKEKLDQIVIRTISKTIKDNDYFEISKLRNLLPKIERSEIQPVDVFSKLSEIFGNCEAAPSGNRSKCQAVVTHIQLSQKYLFSNE